MTETPLDAGHLGSLVWALTSRRLVIRHVSHIPVYLPKPQRIRALMDAGWSANEIGRMYDCGGKAVMERMR